MFKHDVGNNFILGKITKILCRYIKIVLYPHHRPLWNIFIL